MTERLRGPGLLHDLRLCLLLGSLTCEHRCPTGSGLLHNMGQLVCEQAAALPRAGRELPGAEDDVPSHGEGVGVQCARGRRGLRVDMHPDRREVAPEPGLEVGQPAAA